MFYSDGKLISNEDINVAQIIKTSDNQRIIHGFNHKIAVIQETESRLELYYKDQFLKSYTTFNDYYGYDTSKKEAIKEAKDIIKALKIDPKSGLVFKVLQTLKTMPCYLLEEPDKDKRLKCKELDMDNQLFYWNPELLKELIRNWNSPNGGDFDRIMEIMKEIKIETKNEYEDKVIWESV